AGTAGETPPGARGGLRLRQQHLDRAAAGACAVQARRRNLGVVDDQEITRTEPFGKLAHPRMRLHSAAAAHHEKTSAVALRQRTLRDLRRVELVVERRQ